METRVKVHRIFTWITLVVAIATQACGWYLTMAIGAKGDYGFIGKFIPGTFFVIAVIATVVAIVFAILNCKKNVPKKGSMTGVTVFSTVAAAASFIGADIGYLLVGKLPAIALLALCCLAFGIINLILSIKAINEVKKSGGKS